MKEQKKISLESLVSEIEKNGRIGRLGKVFKTEKNYYFYDTGTGKVAKLNSNVYIVLKSLLEGMPVEDIKNLQLSKSEFEDAISEIKSAMENEHILQAPPLKTLTGDAVTELDDILENKVENVTLEVTEKCNLRCKYCIYHPSHPEYRAFGHENMKWDVAKKAIDFLKEHSQNAENRHIGFYGGEPLLNFELIERAVEYAKKLFGEDMSFAITTNATLVNDKIAEYFAKNNFNIIISLDGPQEMHDANRLNVYSIYNANLYIQLLKDFLEIKEGENALGGTKVDNIKTIELRNVSFDYPQCKMALSTINLKIKSNEQIAIVGKNGSGKSTLFKILCGLYKPTSGKLFVNNLDLENIDVKSYRNCISVLFQDFLKYEGTLEENVYIGDISTEVDENKIKNSLCKANVDFLKTERGYELKRGLGNWFDEGGQLSGGQWQKIALARTYYKNADLYLLDEPSSALDVTAETKIFKSFFEVSKNKIAIYITHRVKIAQDANKIIVLDGGKIVGIGTHAELLKNCSVYQDLYNQENLKNKG